MCTRDRGRQGRGRQQCGCRSKPNDSSAKRFNTLRYEEITLSRLRATPCQELAAVHFSLPLPFRRWGRPVRNRPQQRGHHLARLVLQDARSHQEGPHELRQARSHRFAPVEGKRETQIELEHTRIPTIHELSGAHVLDPSKFRAV